MTTGPSKRQPSESPDGERRPDLPGASRRTSWIWLIVIVVVLYAILTSISSSRGRNAAEVPVNRVFALLDDADQSRKIQRIEEVDSNRFEVVLHEAVEVRDERPGEEARSGKFKALSFNLKDEGIRKDLFERARQRDVDISFKDESSQVLGFLLIQILPLVLLVLIFWFMASRVRRQMGPGFFGRFGGNRAKRYEGGKTQVTFDDVASLVNVKKELEEVVSFLKYPDRYTRLGAKIPKGVLLVGPPGTGKTLLARAVAGEAGVPFYSISGSEFIELFVGMGASRVRELFDEAKKNAPCIVFIDEIDAVGRSRGAGLGGGHDEREQTLNQILSEMDGFEITQTVIVLAATNRPDVLDSALVRPGRFDRQVVVERPQREGRRAILQVHTKEIPLSGDVDLDSIARATIGFSGADLRNLANEAALLAARDSKDTVGQEDFERAKDKIMLGTLRDEAMTEQERELTAYHEAGHALIAMLLPQTDPVQSVTIVPRGRALGVTQQLPREETHSYSRTYLTNRVVILLGGRAAEELVFQEFSTGAENDLTRSTELVERMVCRWGMSEKLGPVAFRRGEEHVFLGRELGETKHFSEHTAMLIDDEIRRIIDRAYGTALSLLGEHREMLEKLARELLEREVLGDREIYDLLDMPLPPGLEQPAEESHPAPAAPAKDSVSAADAEPRPAEDIDPGLLGLEGA